MYLKQYLSFSHLISPSHWNSEVEERQHLGSNIFYEHVTDDSRCYRGVARFSDANHGPAY